MVVAGVGMDGEGELNFEGLAYEQAAIKVTPVSNSAGVTIRDLRISGDDSYRGRGIELISAHQVNLERLRISDFGNGIYGRESFSTIRNRHLIFFPSRLAHPSNRISLILDIK